MSHLFSLFTSEAQNHFKIQLLNPLNHKLTLLLRKIFYQFNVTVTISDPKKIQQAIEPWSFTFQASIIPLRDQDTRQLSPSPL